MKVKSIKIMVASHKYYEFPEDNGYFPVQVGKVFSKSDYGVVGDDTGDNISFLNKSFCELTGLYWLWKNQKADIFGLMHYRRYFRPVFGKGLKVKNLEVASSLDLSKLMESFDVVVPKKRCYFIETIKSHYERAHHESDLNALEQLIREESPEYHEAFNKVLQSRCLSLYNMFCMDAKHLDEYLTWLFGLLFKLEKRIPYKGYDSYQVRVFGFLSERLFNVWLEHNKDSLRIIRLPVMNLEGESLLRKTLGLILRRFQFVKKDND